MNDTYAIFASGSGSNAMSLIEMGKNLNKSPRFLLANKKDAGVIKKAEEAGIKVILIETTHPKVDLDFERKIIDICRDHKIKWVFLAGFMKILSQTFLSEFKYENYYRVINIHPSLLPLYKGLNAYDKSFAANDKEYGFTIHLVDEKIDHGEILYQRKIIRNECDSFEDFKNRGLELENKDYPLILEKLLSQSDNFIKSCLKSNSISTQDNHYDK